MLLGVFLIRTWILSDQGSMLMNSFSLKYFHTGPISKYSHLEIRTSVYKFRGYINIHSISWTRGETQFKTSDHIRSDQSLSRVRLFETPCIAARQASLSITNSRSSLRLTSIESVMPSSHLILCRSLLLLPPIPPSIRVFSNESTLRRRWPKYWSFSFSIIPSKKSQG